MGAGSLFPGGAFAIHYFVSARALGRGIRNMDDSDREFLASIDAKSAEQKKRFAVLRARIAARLGAELALLGLLLALMAASAVGLFLWK